MRQIGGFLGLNRTENFKEGQLRDSVGLTSEQYPTLTQSKPFVPYGEQSGIVDMYEHNGKLLTVADNGLLVFDGKNIGYVTRGRKQFAAVNTRLCIFPDKKYIDLNTFELHDLAEGLLSASGSNAVEMGDNSISFATDAPVQEGLSEEIGDHYGEDTDKLCTYSYGTDRNAIAKCWDDANKVWVNLRELQEKKSLVKWDGMVGSGIYGLFAGTIFIPEITDDDGMNIVRGDVRNDPDISRYNTQGIYCVVTDVQTEYEYESGSTNGPDNPYDPINYITNTYFYNAYSATDGSVIFSGTFKEGDIVDVTGTPHSLYDGVGISIAKVDGETNSLIFAQNTFTGALSYILIDEDISGEKIIKARYFVYDSDTPEDETIVEKSGYFSVTIYDTVKAGKWLYFKNDGFIYVWDKTKLTTIGSYEAISVAEQAADIEMLPYSLEGARVRVSRHIPDLDYICESENRLWGVSNRTHTIYASALGLPGEFTEFDVVSTDSYAVAVASEDDFTAICAYGGGVCCFKENRLHKMLGSFPAEYYMNEYEIAGVQKGSERSLQIIDEVLYYKGKYGVYAYSGGVPRLISYE
ncbi:MAG: hypothetical protein IKM67_01155, partial [Clostridia bacterium]|nr:hypothetical protein [Clostridia bacterium]